MPIQMQPSQFPQGGWPECGEGVPKAAATFPKGTVLKVDAGVAEHGGGAAVTGILGVSLEGAAAGVSDNPSGFVNYGKSGRSNIFIASLVNGSGVVQVVDAANKHVEYGILKVGSGLSAWWGVDESDVTNVVVVVVDIDIERNIVFFKFIESAIEEP